MPKETLLQESVRETKETLSRFIAQNRVLTITVVAALVAITGIWVNANRNSTNDVDTFLRADQKTLAQSDPDLKPRLGEDNSDQIPGAATSPIIGGSTTGSSIDAMKGINAPVRAPARTIVTKPDGTPVTTKDGVVVTTIVESSPGSGGTTNTTKPSGGGGTTNTTTGTGFDPAAFNSGRIAYVTGGATWTVSPDGSSPLKVASSAYYPAWSRGRTALAVSDRDGNGSSLSYISYTGGRFALTTGPSGTQNGDTSPTWSPDAGQVAFGRMNINGSAEYSGIWVVNKDGSGLHRIASSACMNREPSWSPDGQRIVFWSSRNHCGTNPGETATGEYELYIVNADGTFLRRLGTAPNTASPAFSPDGQQIAFASDRSGGWEIYVMSAEGGEETRITTSPGDDVDPTWSPDGARIAFRSSRNGGGIFTMKADGSDVRFVVAGSQPAWS